MRCFLKKRSRWFLTTRLINMALTTALVVASPDYFFAQAKPTDISNSAPVAKTVGTIKNIQGDSITVAAESGGDIVANLSDTTKILRVPPGEKDLKKAITLQARDLQPGDRVLVRGQAGPSGDQHTISALSVIVMKQVDLAAKQQNDRDDWQKRGAGGLVTKVDIPASTITISSGGTGTNKSIAIHITKDTVLRRYAPGSVNFDDAKLAPIDQIKAGDQLRARGTRNPDGSEISAEEIVSGAFRNIAGIIKLIDAASNAITVQDAITKTAVVIKVSSDSQVKKLPPEMAQRIALRLKGGTGGVKGDQPGPSGQGTTGQGAGGGTRSGADSTAGHGPGGNGPPDLQRMLSRLPNSKLADLQKGDAVMIVSTESGSSDTLTAITLLAGVEAILTASPSATTLLSPWSLNTAGGEGEAAP